jgi:hypothetical protein
MHFAFPTAASDIDGPVKRCMDAVFRGMREVWDVPHVNDARVYNLSVDKHVDPTPSLAIRVDAWDKAW